jgi:acyl-CoA thioesterase-2
MGAYGLARHEPEAASRASPPPLPALHDILGPMGHTEELDGRRAVDDIVAALSVRRAGDGWAAQMPPDVWGPVVFGGFVIAQAVVAATRQAPEDRLLHSLHAYFLRPVAGGRPVSYRNVQLRNGKTMALRRLDAEQEGEHVLTMTCSFTADAEGYEYQATLPSDLPEPEGLPTRGIGPWVIAELGPTGPEPDGTRRSTHRMWFRTAARLPDDPHLLAAFIAFASDITYKGGRPLHLEGDTRGMISIDHAMWFHRPLRPDTWSYYDVHSLINARGRGLLRGTMYSEDGLLCVSVAQEMVLKRYEEATPR